MRATLLRLLVLLALAALAAGSQRRAEAAPSDSGGTAAGGAGGGGEAAAALAGGPLPVRSTLTSTDAADQHLSGEQASAGGSSSSAAAEAAEAPHSDAALADAAPFQHPLTPPEQRRDRRTGSQAHADMQRWLRAFFRSNASRLTSTRLQAAQAAAAASGGHRPLPLAEGEAGDVLATAGGQPCNASCARRAAEQLLVASESPGHGYMPLAWPQFPEDRRRWAAAAATDGSGAGCKPRQPGEPIGKDYLVVAAVGNDLSSVNRWGWQPFVMAAGCVLWLAFQSASIAARPAFACSRPARRAWAPPPLPQVAVSA